MCFRWPAPGRCASSFSGTRLSRCGRSIRTRNSRATKSNRSPSRPAASWASSNSNLLTTQNTRPTDWPGTWPANRFTSSLSRRRSLSEQPTISRKCRRAIRFMTRGRSRLARRAPTARWSSCARRAKTACCGYRASTRTGRLARRLMIHKSPRHSVASFFVSFTAGFGAGTRFGRCAARRASCSGSTNCGPSTAWPSATTNRSRYERLVRFHGGSSSSRPSWSSSPTRKSLAEPDRSGRAGSSRPTPPPPARRLKSILPT